MIESFYTRVAYRLVVVDEVSFLSSRILADALRQSSTLKKLDLACLILTLNVIHRTTVIYISIYKIRACLSIL